MLRHHQRAPPARLCCARRADARRCAAAGRVAARLPLRRAPLAASAAADAGPAGGGGAGAAPAPAGASARPAYVSRGALSGARPPPPMGGGGGFSGGSRPAGGPGGRRDPRSAQPRGPPMNEAIRAPTLRVVGQEKEPVGVMSREDALRMADEADVDLVMISPEADPPVARLMNYSKYRYEQEQKAKDAKKKIASSRQDQKELKMRYNIGSADYEVRLRAAQRFLKDGDKVKLLCQFKGREMDFKSIAFDMFTKFAGELKEDGVVEGKPSIEGRSLIMFLAPLSRSSGETGKAAKAAQQQKAAAAAPGGAGGAAGEAARPQPASAPPQPGAMAGALAGALAATVPAPAAAAAAAAAARAEAAPPPAAAAAQQAVGGT